SRITGRDWKRQRHVGSWPKTSYGEGGRDLFRHQAVRSKKTAKNILSALCLHRAVPLSLFSRQKATLGPVFLPTFFSSYSRDLDGRLRILILPPLHARTRCRK